VYKKYGNAIFGIISRIVRDDHSSEEVLQNTFLKVWKSISDYDENKSSLFTWIAVIARNTALDLVRLKKFQNLKKTDSLDITVYNDSARAENISSTLEYDSLIKGLEPKYKVVIDKIYLEGYSQSQAAELLEIPLGTVKTRLKYAVNILRENLGSEKSTLFGMFVLIMLTIIFFLCQ